MSISPLKSSASPIELSAKPADERLTLSQALLITAGLAGLVGLCSGAIIRFSLANSPDASFLSPLQTFPALANWAPELPQGTADSHYLPGGSAGLDGRADSRSEFQAPSQVLTFERPNESNSKQRFDPSTFDTFAGRSGEFRRIAEPLEALQNGPATLGTARDDFERPSRELSDESSAYSGENYPAVEDPSFDDRTYYEGGDQQ